MLPTTPALSQLHLVRRNIQMQRRVALGRHHRKWDNEHKYAKKQTIDKQDMKNYRPRKALYHQVNKVFSREYRIRTRITLEYHSKLFPRMTAYRKSYSCETTLLTHWLRSGKKFLTAKRT